MSNRILIAILSTFLTIFLSAKPARPTITTLVQPDGSTFTAISYGDEFTKITTTTQGHAIMRNDEGWWCYAIYNSDGSIQGSGYHIGGHAPSHIISSSRTIPYKALAERALARKSPAGIEEQENIMKRVRKAQGPLTKTDGKIVKHGIVILAEYSDIKFSHSRQDIVNLLTQKDYSVNGATGCAKDYFDRQFNGKYEFSFDVSDIVTLSSPRAYYGRNDSYGDDMRPAEMAVEACRLADEAGIDFSLYDDDADGNVDNVFIFFAGEDEADDPGNNESCIWSHAWYIKSGAGISLSLDGKTIDQYACTSELFKANKKYVLTGIGTFCHEFSHTLGLPDFYDTDYEENGWAAGLWGRTSLMDGGNSNNNCNTPPFFNAIEQEIMGLAEPLPITHNGSYILKPLQAGGQTYKIESDSPDEYFLIECRGNKEWDAYIGGYGMLVYHVDKSNPQIWDLKNKVNTIPDNQYADLIEADCRSDILTESNYWHLMNNISGIFFPYAGTTAIGPDTNHDIRFRNGSKTTISITGIKRNGEEVSFSVHGLKGEEPPTAVNIKVEAFMDAAILNFESDRPFEGNAVIEWKRTDHLAQTLKVAPYEIGKYSIVLEGLTPGNKTYSAEICFETDDTTGESKKVSFMTNREVPVSWPHIHFGKAANEDGTFNIGAKLPMRVYNASQAEAIRWEFNGNRCSPGGDGYLTVTGPGTLRAIVYWPDGSKDILEKTIIISE